MSLEIGYKALLEVHEPDVLLKNVRMAEKYGFKSAYVDDHFHPWAHTQAHGSFAWVWIASAAETTSNMRYVTAVTAPTFRYHPAIVAQAFATLAYMYPNRIVLGLGAGEALNETTLGYPWPSPKERVERLEEAIVIIKKLWTEDFVNFSGKHYKLKKANLYTKPKNPPKIYVAAGGPKVAELAGRFGDGIFLDSGLLLYDPAKMLNMLRIFDKAAEKEGKDPLSLAKITEIMVSYGQDYEAALKSCRFWAGVMLPLYPKYDISDPREIEALGKFVGKEAIEERFVVGGDADKHVERARRYIDEGFNKLVFLNSGPDEQEFIRFYGDKILPHIRD